jgi:hypothetical protein
VADVSTSPCFEKDFKALIAEPRHEFMDGLLKKRLPAGDFHEAAVKGSDFAENIFHRQRLSLFERVRRIAIGAAKIAGCQANEDTREPCSG